MIDLTLHDTGPRSLRVREFYLGRQPILDRNQTVFGYELLFRNAPVGPAHITNELSATAAVIAHASQLGMEKTIGDALGFVNVDADVLMTDIFSFLPREKVVLEVAESMPLTPQVLARMTDLAGHGFRFALDDFSGDGANMAALLPLTEYVKMDMRALPPSTLARLAPRFQQDQKKLVAEKVETRDEFKTCLDLGFDYFQGYYFSKPVIMSGKKLSPSQLAVMELMTLVTSDADNQEIERAIKRDVSLALNLLRLVNTPAVGARQRIDSLSQAVTILGRRQLQRWLQIMLYAEPSKRGHSMTPLLMLATTRGRLLELLAGKLRPSHRHVADIAFTVGIMSLMDTLFGMPMAEILAQIPVNDEVSQALLHRAGFFGDLLKLAECIERIEDMDDQIMPALNDLAISTDELVELEMSAFEWSDNVVRYAL
ncbi:EAL domain-containing protein [Duganella sp. BJB488]|uniref:EAL and HDOD domain-containing protein n=1 Tax=unclassified Duganella TaxID=2636909 RepID=UPI000E3490E5|nr:MULTISPECIES: EAL domain-containing protein [unclassified Duganella]NVD70361.1 EAL domain-containing protein [Duganella sp. BJB1802]RFP22749.1 EAL domain-containing protein [Duganella sp. BJB489]RFP25176.1 EAL domain-containing protein [Duganella sp. BJB488]RFP33748.1 EAL domain-containing protein [Duganella sp. BJB480]